MSHIGQNLEIPVTVSVGEINLTTDDLQNPKNPPEVLLHQPSGGLTGTGGLRGHSHYFTVWHHAATITQCQFWGQLSCSRDLSIATNSKTTNTIIFLAKLVVCLFKTFLKLQISKVNSYIGI